MASSANYGIIGNGRLHIASTLSSPSGTAGIKLDKLSVSLFFTFFFFPPCGQANPQLASYETQDSLYDLSWSEVHENQLVTVSGDGSIKLWDVMLNVSTRTSLPSLERR